MSSPDLFVKINSLPSDMRKEVEMFIDALLKRGRKTEPQRKRIPIRQIQREDPHGR